ncbi:MAG: killer suppression protein [Verrucomicrobiota bacterium]
MNIAFKTKKLEKTLNTEKALNVAYGKNAKPLKRRLAVLRAALCLGEVSHLPPDRRHELTGNRKGTFAVDLKHPHRLVFKPNHNSVPEDEDGGIDLTKVTAIMILGVEDYH